MERYFMIPAATVMWSQSHRCCQHHGGSLPEFVRKGGVKYQSGADENKVWGGLVAFPFTLFVGALISVSEPLGLRTSSCAS